MRVVHLSTYDFIGGAARAAHRLSAALARRGVESRMVVRATRREDPAIVMPGSALARGYALVRAYLDARLPGALYRRKVPGNFSAAVLPERASVSVNALAPDLVHVHWIGENFVRPEGLRGIGRPTVWTLHDSWAFTGGCFLPGACERFVDRCGACPVLASTKERDLSRRVWHRKSRAWQSMSLTIVAPSHWMADRAARSGLLGAHRIEVIPNAVDAAVFHPIGRDVARDVLRLPRDRAIVLFAAHGASSDANKGMDLLAAALRELASTRPDVRLLVAGSSGSELDPGVPVDYLGPLSDEISMVLAYAAADVVAIPSRQENLPNAAVEAMACGRPVVAFRVGGIPEVVADREAGVLVEPYDTSGFAHALRWIIEDEARWLRLSGAARARAVEEFEADRVADRHLALYDDILSSSRATALETRTALGR